MALSRPKPGESYRKTGPVWNDPEFRENFPTIESYLTQKMWDDGSHRLMSTITLFISDDSLTLILNDRDNNRSAFVNESSLYSALAKLEEQLQADTVEWKRKKEVPQQGKDIPF